MKYQAKKKVKENTINSASSFGIIARIKGKSLLSGFVRPIEYVECKSCYSQLNADCKCRRVITDEDLYIVIQRKDSCSYNDILRGRYKDHNRDKLLEIYISEISCTEKKKLETMSFKELFDDLFLNHDCYFYKNDFQFCEKKWNKNREKIIQLLNEKVNHIPISEIEFPKGKLNKGESPTNGAKREFFEECGLPSDILNLDENKYVDEIFIGTNGVTYNHRYFLADIQVDNLKEADIQFLEKQLYEVVNVGFFTKDTILSILRDYDIEKKKMFLQAVRIFNNDTL